jgi:hypothetical protein
MRPQPCARPGCTTTAAFESLCPEHHDVARQILGDDACAKGTCLSRRYRASRLCRDHFEEEAFGKVTTRWTERSQVRRAAPATHLSPVRVLEISSDIFTDPAAKDDRYPTTAGGAWTSRRTGAASGCTCSPTSTGAWWGHLSACVHTNNTALFRALEVDARYRQRIGSALYEAFRAEHPDLRTDLGYWVDGRRAGGVIRLG